MGFVFFDSLAVANPCLTHMQRNLTETCFYIHITDFSVNVTWFALLSSQKFDDRLLFKPEALCLFCSVGRVFTNGLVDLGSVPGRVITKTLKIVLDTSLLNTQQYTVRIKGKVE